MLRHFMAGLCLSSLFDSTAIQNVLIQAERSRSWYHKPHNRQWYRDAPQQHQVRSRRPVQIRWP